LHRWGIQLVICLPLCHFSPCFPLISSDILIKISLHYISLMLAKTNTSNCYNTRHKKTEERMCILLRSWVLESGSGTCVVAITVDKTSPLLPISTLVLKVGVVFLVATFPCVLGTACRLDEAYLFTVTVSAINMLCPIELLIGYFSSVSFSNNQELSRMDNEMKQNKTCGLY